MSYEGCKNCQYHLDGCFINGFPDYISDCPCLICLIKSMCKKECSTRASVCGNIFKDFSTVKI